MARAKRVTKELSLEDILWNCRDILRGKASMATRRDAVLSLVFLKFISDKFYRQRQRLSLEFPDEKQQATFLEKDVFYQKDGVFYLPQDCRWDTLLTIEANKLPLAIDTCIAKIDSLQESLHGALP